MHYVRNYLIALLISTVLSTGGLFWPPIAAGATPQLTLGVFPRRNAKTTVQNFKPIADYLAQALGMEVTVITAKNFPEFWQGVLDNKYDIVHYNQYHYIDSHDHQGYQVILKNEEYHSTTIAGAFAVKKDSGIKSLTDLKGKRILFAGGKRAMIAYIVNTAMLRRAGLEAGDYQELFAKNPPNAVIATYYGHADAAGIGNIGLNLQQLDFPGIDVDEMVLIGESEPLPHLPWAVKADMSQALRDKIQRILLGLNDSARGRKILQQAELTGLRPASDAEYNLHRNILKELQGDPALKVDNVH